MFDSSDQIAALDAVGLLELAAENRRARLEAERLELDLAAHWADLNAPASQRVDAGRAPRLSELPIVERSTRPGGAGTPEVLEFAAAELGAVLHMTMTAATSLMADALDLRHRLPRVWALVHAGQVRQWQARQVARASRLLDLEAARVLDAAVAGSMVTLSWSRFLALFEAKIIEADPVAAEERARAAEAARFVRGRHDENGLMLLIARATAGDTLVFLALVDRIAEILGEEGDLDDVDVRRSKAIGIIARPADAVDLLYRHRSDVDPTLPSEPTNPGEDAEPADHGHQPPRIDPKRVRPLVHLFVHLSEEALRAGTGVARLEGIGPLTLDQVRRFLGESGHRIRLYPVVDLNDRPAPVDCYEIPDRLRTHLRLRQPGSAFPWSPSTSRRMDHDHTIAYLAMSRGGPPGQTRLDNLGPMVRREHRIKTFSRWRHRQPEPDVHVWRSPHGWTFLVDPAGSHDLGRGPFARAAWRAAKDISEPPSSTAGKIVELRPLA